MIILKYGNVKRMNKNSPRRKHKCSNCGCKVLLDEADFKVCDRDHDCWRYTYECPFCTKDVSFEVYDKPGVIRFFKDCGRNFDNFLWRHDLGIIMAVVGVTFTMLATVFIPFAAYYSWQNNHHAYRMNFNIGGKSDTEWTDSYKIVDGDVIFRAGEKKYCVDMDEIVVIDTKTGEEIDVYGNDRDNSQEDS